MPDVTAPNELGLEIHPPRHYGLLAMLAVHVYGLLLILPVLASVVVMSLLPPGYGPLLLPLAGIFFTVYFLPLGLGNSYVTRLVRSFCPEAQGGQEGYVVQVTFVPRLRKGIRALIEDADDVGFLRFEDSAMVFQGDSVRLALPYEKLNTIRAQNIGMRGLFVYGRRIEVPLPGFAGAEAVQIAERASLVLPSSRRLTRQLREQFITRTTTPPPTSAS